MIGAVNQYTYRAEWSPESGEYIGMCVEFPSRYSRAQSAHEAIEGIRAGYRRGGRRHGGLRRDTAGNH